MTPRLNYAKANPEALKVLYRAEQGARALGLDAGLLHLIRLRASQINGCAYCIAMHTREARADGEDQRRLDLLQGWRETDLFDAREKAALGWTEALTEVARTHAPDGDYAALEEAFDPAERVAVTVAVTTINAWNRLAIGFRAVPEA